MFLLVSACSGQTEYTWRLAWTAPPSGGSTLFGLAYDQVRNQAVLLDNAGGTWTWSSEKRTWARRYAAHNPSNRSAGPLVWDGNLGGVLLFGGNAGGAQNDTWLWDGSDWKLLNPEHRPPVRYGSNLAWDSAQKRVVLFGGQTGATLNVTYNDVWLWDGNDWMQVFASGGAPPARYNFAMTYDPAGQAVVIYGGNRGTPATTNDTWLLTTQDGIAYTWSNPLGPAPTDDFAPAARNNVVMTWDPVHKTAVLFGGSANNAETWAWDTTAQTWTFQGLRVAATGRNQHLMWWDQVLKRVMVTGGTGGGSLNDIWSWDGESANWVPETPNLRFGSTLTYDSAQRRIYLTMGSNGLGNTKYSDWWSWDGERWILSPVTGAPINPVPRALAQTVYDPVRRSILTYGGSNGTGTGGTINTNYVYNWTPGTRQWAGNLPGVRPDTRIGYGWAYVPGPGKPVTVLFGGGDILPTIYNNTYVWDSAAKTFTAQTGTSPSARGGTSMVYDAARGQLVLFGGTTTLNQTTTNVTVAGVDYNDTWTARWDGNAVTWSNAVSNGAAGSPAARSWHSMAFDGQSVWMTGGMAKGDQKAQQQPGQTALFFNDLWRWDGASWTQVVPATGPAGLSAMAMGFDPDHGTSGPDGKGQLMLFGGNFMTGTGNGTVNPTSNTWVWDVAQPGTINVSTYTTRSGLIEELPNAGYTLYGPCQLGDASPCRKDPVAGGPAYSAGGQAPGFYSITYAPVPGLTTPAAQNLMLNPGDSITFSADYK